MLTTSLTTGELIVAITEKHRCDRERMRQIGEELENRQADADEREALQRAEIEATENLAIFLDALWVPFEMEHPETPYRAFCRLRDRYIAAFGKRFREGSETTKIKASWLLLVYGTDEQADVFLSGAQEKREALLNEILSAGGMKAERGQWMELPE